jgi:hypothetical protein
LGSPHSDHESRTNLLNLINCLPHWLAIFEGQRLADIVHALGQLA